VSGLLLGMQIATGSDRLNIMYQDSIRLIGRSSGPIHWVKVINKNIENIIRYNGVEVKIKPARHVKIIQIVNHILKLAQNNKSIEKYKAIAQNQLDRLNNIPNKHNYYVDIVVT
jgi:hypothetical protein